MRERGERVEEREARGRVRRGRLGVWCAVWDALPGEVLWAPLVVVVVGGVGLLKGRGWGRIRRRWRKREIEPYCYKLVSR